MTNKEVDKLRMLAQDFLQYRYKMFIYNGERRAADWNYYQGACDMLCAFGGDWKRFYKGDDSKEQLADINNYHHVVWFPDKQEIAKLNEDAWK